MTARRGVALVLVLWVIVILGGIAASVTALTRTTGDVAGAARARAKGRYAAESGVVAAVAHLTQRLTAVGDDTTARRALLNAPLQALGAFADFALGDAQVTVAVLDVSALLDVNAASEAALATLFRGVGHAADAAGAARAIRAHVEGRDGRPNPLRSLDALAVVSGVSAELLQDAAPYLTVDGAGTINRRTAPSVVLAAAAGSVQDEPSRLLIVARGWQRGHPLTHEVQVVYAIQGTQLALVRWRERDR